MVCVCNSSALSLSIRVRLHSSVGKIQGLGLQSQQIVTCPALAAISVL